ncbi:MAG: hypothetical protein JO111_04500 [Caulobacteraceae bacterium]|nr:hypothetical protein [Caulobacteraceae bacterium]
MNDEARRAYVASVRAHARGLQTAGFVGCLVGVLLMLSGHYVRGVPHWMVYVGLVIILVGWALFAFAIVRRSAYVRSHPFDPDH